MAELREFDTALLANTLAYVEPIAAHEFYLSGEIGSVTPGLGPTVGRAVTVEMDSSTPDNVGEMEPFWRQLEEMLSGGVPSVWVVKAIGSRPGHECVLGDGMAKLLYSVGCAGVVTDGGVRDVAGLLTIPFAAYCRGTTIHHTELRLTNPGKPVEVGGVTIRPGDIIHASAEGVIRIPPSAANLPTLAVKMRAAEHAIHLQFRRTDISLAAKRQHALDVFAEYGFAKSRRGHGHELK